MPLTFDRSATHLCRMASELEASKAAAVKSVKDLQARLAAEHAQMLKLQVGGRWWCGVQVGLSGWRAWHAASAVRRRVLAGPAGMQERPAQPLAWPHR